MKRRSTPTKPWALARVVEVEWDDACSQGGWGSDASYRERSAPLRTRSTGYLFHDDAEGITLMQTQANDNERFAESITIPRGMIRRVRRLKR